MIAPDSNRSASARSITTRQPLWAEEIEFGDGTKGFATDGTPVDCVRFASLGLIGEPPELIVSGINHGANLGDDITYSGTVAAALEGVVLGLPAIAVSQQSQKREMDFRLGREFDFTTAATFTARLVEKLPDRPLASGTLLNVNCPAVALEELAGARVTRMGKRIYRDRLELTGEDSDGGRRKRYRIYGMEPSYHSEDGTDFAAIDDGHDLGHAAALRSDGPAAAWSSWRAGTCPACWSRARPHRPDARRPSAAPPTRPSAPRSCGASSSTTTTGTTSRTIRRSPTRSTTTCCAS